MPRRTLLLYLCLLLPALCDAAGEVPEPVEFNRDIRPILADRCFTCHGPDQGRREADLRLDVEAEAMSDRGGYRVIVSGDPEASELVRRVTAEDPVERMPPDGAGPPLSVQQTALLRRWIEQGAPWQVHWAWLPPRRPDVPRPLAGSPEGSAIDRFVARQRARRGIEPAAQADRRILLRRLSFDLLGLPPTMEQVASFVNDSAADAVERVVEGMLASEHFGERMALYWLDVVRYADTGGYHSDNHRDLYLYRDYVIGAFNENLPFDQFTIEQLAGDLLPAATPQQRIASGYNRLLQTTEEGGAQPKEYTAKYQADRVRNTAAAWLGITLGCAECHDHKFDPYTMRDFYSFAAFFADIEERPVGRQDQTLFPTAQQQEQLAELEVRKAELQKEWERSTPELEAAQRAWEETLRAQLARGRRPPRGITGALREALARDPPQRSPEQQAAVAERFRRTAPELANLRDRRRALAEREESLRKSVPQTLISISTARRVVRILPRGNWLDDSGDAVQPATPAALPPSDEGGATPPRLRLAHWLASPENPLTARVFVNRLWKVFFGAGLVRTLDDFGTQGQWPTHPELLDWLAVEFIDSGWNVKQLVKQIVLSRTYQLSSAGGASLERMDPSNRWLGRQNRFRLDAELVRDNALAISGLLAAKVGGPSVKPYQPEGYWRHLNFPKRQWQHDRGEDLYRRGLYTYWQRTFLHPSLSAFDAPSREECTVERPRSNTPLQALVLLNDPTYVEAARTLAAKTLAEAAGSDGARLDFAYRRALNRLPSPRETDLLLELLADHQQRYGDRREDAELLLGVGQQPPPEDRDAATLAAWTSVMRVILNLHETITRF